ncbi:hypothetical protein BGX24_010849 [Mortierella sp. AD032]|nr:hypothetical protein BGX24_010849 [Mortierella sp. AD032]
MPPAIEPMECLNVGLEKLFLSPVNTEMVEFVADYATKVLDSIQPPAPMNASAISAITDDSASSSALPATIDFIKDLLQNSKVPARCLLSSLVYIQRLKEKLAAIECILNCSHHRVFLACLILASKNLSDGCPWNRHWAEYSMVFSLAQVNSMENQVLDVLNFDIRIAEADLWHIMDGALLYRQQQQQPKQQQQQQLQQQQLQQQQLQQPQQQQKQQNQQQQQRQQLQQQQQRQLEQLQQQHQQQVLHLEQLQQLQQKQKEQQQHLRQQQQQQEQKLRLLQQLQQQRRQQQTQQQTQQHHHLQSVSSSAAIHRGAKAAAKYAPSRTKC